jgi:hypothetical protein
MDGISINEQSIILNRLTAIHEIPSVPEKGGLIKARWRQPALREANAGGTRVLND